MKTQKIAKIIDGCAKKSHGKISLIITNSQGGTEWQSQSGERTLGGDCPFFIASATKLYTTAIVMQLRSEGRLALDDSISKILPHDLWKDLLVLDSKDYSQAITVRQLLAHNSGLPNYFEQKQRDGKILFHEVVNEHDRGWTFSDVIDLTKTRQKPKFAPHTPRRAYYSDTNYQLLGAIVETITGQSFEENLEARIIRPLALKNTYMFTPNTMDQYDRIAVMYNGRKPLHIPKAMASFRADGGMVSTANDSVKFLQAFMKGGLFPESFLGEMKAWNRIFFPLEYGIGLMRFKLPWLFSPFKRFPELIGHSGASGTVLFYCPELDLYFVGTVNQIANRGMSYKLMIQVMNEFMK